MPGIVVQPLRLVYWPITKNACTSVKTRIAEMLDIKWAGVIHDAPFQWSETSLPGYTDFALIRHPLARLYSLWANKIGPHRAFPAGLDNSWLNPHVFGAYGDHFHVGMTFDNFARAVLTIPKPDGNPHWLPQTGQFPTGTRTFKLESVDPLLKLFLPRLNFSTYSGGSWRLAYSEAMREAFVDYYWEDFSRFEYVQ